MKTLLFILLAGLAIAQTPQPGSGAAAGGCAAAAGTANAVLVDSSGCPSDSAITIIPGSYAGGVAMPQGTDPGTAGSWPANSAGIVAPSSVGTAYRWMMPAADANGFILSSGAGTPGVLSIVGFSGTGNVPE